MRGGANFMDQIAATPVIVDTLQGDTGPEATGGYCTAWRVLGRDSTE